MIKLFEITKNLVLNKLSWPQFLKVLKSNSFVRKMYKAEVHGDSVVLSPVIGNNMDVWFRIELLYIEEKNEVACKFKILNIVTYLLLLGLILSFTSTLYFILFRGGEELSLVIKLALVVLPWVQFLIYYSRFRFIVPYIFSKIERRLPSSAKLK